MNASANTGTNSLKPFFNLAIFIGVLVGLYYLYQWLYGSQGSKSSVTLIPAGKTADLSSPKQTITGSTNPSVAQYEISGVQDGGEYSMTFWVYITKTSGFTQASSSTPLAHLIDISNDRFSESSKGNTLVFVGMNPLDGTLIVRQNTQEVKINNAADSSSATEYPLTSLISSYNLNDTFKKDDRCDILNGIEYQRWVMIGVVANSRTLDVYVDGKLARSCVYTAPFGLNASGSTNVKATIGNNEANKLYGSISTGEFYDYALTPDKMWTKYMAGPKGEFSVTSFFNSIFSTEFSINTGDAPQ
jgi:hypothetical protein